MVALDIGHEDLVDRVVREVMRRLQPTVLCLFTGGTGSRETVSWQLGEMAALPCQFLCVFSRAAASVLGTEFAAPLRPSICIVEGAGETISTPGLVSECKMVVVPVLSQNTAVKAAAGIRDSLASEILACAFMMGKPVILARDSIATEEAPAGYRQMLLGRLEALERYGARVITARELSVQVKAILEGPSRRLVDLQAATAWVKEHGNTGPFPVAPGTIVTPLAVDFFKEKHIPVAFETLGTGACEGKGGGKPC